MDRHALFPPSQLGIIAAAGIGIEPAGAAKPSTDMKTSQGGARSAAMRFRSTMRSFYRAGWDYRKDGQAVGW